MGPTYHETEEPRRRRRGLLVLLLAGSLTAMIGAGSMSIALFTDDDAVGGSFTAGTVIIDATPATLGFTVDPLMPGDSTEADVNVLNDGSGDFRYAMEAATTGDLGPALELTVYEDTCAAKGPVVGTAGSALDGYGFGDKTSGGDVGDRDLAAGADEDFCFVVELPKTADDTYQDASATATFTFYAEQTVNNP